MCDWLTIATEKKIDIFANSPQKKKTKKTTKHIMDTH